jgi:serine/threonine protein kinase
VEVVDGRFALEREHRRGGMGTVWRARDLQSQRPIALKLLHSSTLEQHERFQREALLLAELAHGSIVSYVASGRTAAGVPYLAMEWLEGETLAERLARQPLSLRETLALARVTASGLAVAHRRGIVHRDLKPSNLFLRASSVDDVVLLDLGIARRITSSVALTQAGAVLGTPSYMAPEQAQGRVDIVPAADVFSLGCVLFECLSGAPPFTGHQVLTVLARLLFEETPSLRELRPELPAPLCELIARMLAKPPGQRPADADAVLAGLAGLDSVADLAGPSAPAPIPPPRTSAV